MKQYLNGLIVTARYLTRALIVCGFTIGFLTGAGAQTLSQRPGWRDLVAGSTVTAVGTVGAETEVIRPDKFYLPPQKQPDGSVIVPTPDPTEYVLGRVVSLRVETVYKRPRGGIKRGDVLNIFIPGWPYKEGDPNFTAGGKYLVFLYPARETKFANAVIERGSDAGRSEPFDPSKAFSVVFGDKGVVPMTPENQRVISEVKAALRRRRHTRRRR